MDRVGFSDSILHRSRPASAPGYSIMGVSPIMLRTGSSVGKGVEGASFVGAGSVDMGTTYT